MPRNDLESSKNLVLVTAAEGLSQVCWVRSHLAQLWLSLSLATVLPAFGYRWLKMDQAQFPLHMLSPSDNPARSLL
jgi:hypothetical protein